LSLGRLSVLDESGEEANGFGRVNDERSDFEVGGGEALVESLREEVVEKRLGKGGVAPEGVGGKDLSLVSGLNGESSASLSIDSDVETLRRRSVSRSVSSRFASF
jgi:hypothetical protein